MHIYIRPLAAPAAIGGDSPMVCCGFVPLVPSERHNKVRAMCELPEDHTKHVRYTYVRNNIPTYIHTYKHMLCTHGTIIIPLIISMTSSWVFPITVMPFTYVYTHDKIFYTCTYIESYVYMYCMSCICALTCRGFPR